MRIFFLKNIVIISLLLFFFSFAHPDTYILKNGNRVTGKLIKETETHYIVDTEGMGEVSIAKDSVEKVIKVEKPKVKITIMGSNALIIGRLSIELLRIADVHKTTCVVPPGDPPVIPLKANPIESTIPTYSKQPVIMKTPKR